MSTPQLLLEALDECVASMDSYLVANYGSAENHLQTCDDLFAESQDLFETEGYRLGLFGTEAWISCIEPCPDSPEYGQIVVSAATMWDSPEMLTQIATIPHGADVTVYGPAREGFYRVEADGFAGYVQEIFIVTRNPATGFDDDCTWYLP